MHSKNKQRDHLDKMQSTGAIYLHEKGTDLGRYFPIWLNSWRKEYYHIFHFFQTIHPQTKKRLLTKRVERKMIQKFSGQNVSYFDYSSDDGDNNSFWCIKKC